MITVNLRDTESTERIYSLPDRRLPAMRARRGGRVCRSGKRSQPCGHDLVIGWLDATGRIYAKEHAPKANDAKIIKLMTER